MYGNLRSNSQNEELLVIPYVKNKTFATWAFSVCSPELWNNSPTAIRCSDTLENSNLYLKHIFLLNTWLMNLINYYCIYTTCKSSCTAPLIPHKGDFSTL